MDAAPDFNRADVDLDDWIRFKDGVGAHQISWVTHVGTENVIVGTLGYCVGYDQIVEIRKPRPSKPLDTDFVFNEEQA
jgi:hypothetical protein